MGGGNHTGVKGGDTVLNHSCPRVGDWHVRSLVDTLLGQGFDVGFCPPPHEGGRPLAYGCHSLYHDLASRSKGIALHGPAGTFSVAPVASGVKLKTRTPVVCVLRPAILDAELFWPALRRASRCTGVNLVVKSLGLEEAEIAVRHHGVRPYSGDEGWSGVARWDDQTFPEVILDLSRPGATDRECPDTVFDSYQGDVHEAEQIGKEVAGRWMDWYVSRRPEFDRAELMDYYDHALGAANISRADQIFVGRYRQEHVAFAYASRISASQADLWVCLSSPEPVFLARRFFNHMRTFFTLQGLCYLGLGGSELRGLFHFKRRLGGRLLLPRTHLLVSG